MTQGRRLSENLLIAPTVSPGSLNLAVVVEGDRHQFVAADGRTPTEGAPKRLTRSTAPLALRRAPVTDTSGHCRCVTVTRPLC